jgi:hypothetical protein
VFISSVRRGLEQERDALPGLLLAIGHQPLRFEDFGAQAQPSREACLRGVEAADAYLLLLGPHYGHRFEATGQSPTQDEWTAATWRGIPRLVFRKRGVSFDPDQETFAQMVGDYASGVFYSEFSGLDDLQLGVAQAIRSLAESPIGLTYQPLTKPASFQWADGWREPSARESAPVELHISPVPPVNRSARQMRELPDQIVTALRMSGALPAHAGVAINQSAEAAIVGIPSEPARHNEIRPTELLGVRINSGGQLSFWAALPRDGMGALLDQAALSRWFTDTLRVPGP